MLGGGIWSVQNKVLPGSYINVISKAYAAMGVARGVAAIGLPLDWGADGKIVETNPNDFYNKSMELFGYDSTAKEMQSLREVLLHAEKVLVYNLQSGGSKASNTFCTAKSGGSRGNSMKVVVEINVNDTSKYDVSLYVGTALVDKQTVSSSADLKDNAYVEWKKTASLSATAGTNLSGGTNGTVNANAHNSFLTKLEPYPVNVIACMSSEESVQRVYYAFVKRMRDSIGTKCQVVCAGLAADHEGVINVSDINVVPWITGAEAGCAINATLTNRVYDGELELTTVDSQATLEGYINSGVLAMHRVGSSIRVLRDINSLVSATSEKSQIFSDNHTVRIVDQLVADVANLFNTRYLGIVPNDDDGRTSLQCAIIDLMNGYAQQRAIDPVSEADVRVEMGVEKTAVVVYAALAIFGVMEKLYMTVTVQ